MAFSVQVPFVANENTISRDFPNTIRGNTLGEIICLASQANLCQQANTCILCAAVRDGLDYDQFRKDAPNRIQCVMDLVTDPQWAFPSSAGENP